MRSPDTSQLDASRVVYEVRLELHDAAPELLDEFTHWLSGHIGEMTALPGFVDGRLLSEQSLDERIAPSPTGTAPEWARDVFVVHYTLHDRAALDAYFSDHAERMQRSGRERFGDSLSATRRVLASPTDALAPVADAHSLVCKNCSRPLLGQYCRACGQRDTHKMISLWQLIREFLGDAFELDSRFWRTVIPLLTRPGHLTGEYLRGRRVHYMPPLRMYLVITLALFFMIATVPGLYDVFVLQNTGGGVSLNVDLDGDSQDESASDSPAEAPQPSEDGSDDTQEDSDDFDIEDCEELELEIGLSNEQWSRAIEERIVNACRQLAINGTAGLGRDLMGNVPTMMFFFLPLIALVMKLLYAFSRRYYVEHLLFLVHFHSFAFLLIALTLLLEQLGGKVAALSGPIEWLSIGVTLYFPFYLYRSMRVVYGQGRAATLGKFALLALAYLIGLSLTFLIATALTVLART